MRGVTDEDLVQAVQAGDTDSLGVLVSRWEQPLYRFIYRMLPRREDAHDVCQETFLRILRRADRYRPGSRFSTWMYQIALNLCRDQARKRKRWGLILAERHEFDERQPGLENGSTGAADPAASVERDEMTRAVRRAMEQIPQEQREVLIMKEFEGLKFREIAEILGCPESTVKSRMYYGLSGLRQVLVRSGIHHP
ncbi:MAG TPA: sigma-70 family RNA polymerase sigma factor [Candidatus Polarisedimenticolaceae bacterium]|nr:sigma-70 family RNA polymerase sigma factor [Candidatus Polarisedimenticolaceae bacterium]